MKALSIYESFPDPEGNLSPVRHFLIKTSSPNTTEDAIKASGFLPDMGHKHPVVKGIIASTLALKPSADDPSTWEADLTYASPPPCTPPGAPVKFSPVIPKKRRRGPEAGQSRIPTAQPPKAAPKQA